LQVEQRFSGTLVFPQWSQLRIELASSAMLLQKPRAQLKNSKPWEVAQIVF
jgi:hypothetical protein